MKKENLILWLVDFYFIDKIKNGFFYLISRKTILKEKITKQEEIK